MFHRSDPRLVASLALLALLLAAQFPALADEKLPAANIDLEALYQRLRPGMTVQEFARAAGRETMLKPGEPLRTWLLWTPPLAGRPIEVLRTAFKDGRLARIEYESFGDEYRHLVKGDSRMEIDSDQVTRLWRRSAEVMEAAEDCGEALEAFHQLVVGLQERLTSAEQQAWVRALKLRRAAQAGLSR
jgi:hypothetical protein